MTQTDSFAEEDSCGAGVLFGFSGMIVFISAFLIGSGFFSGTFSRDGILIEYGVVLMGEIASFAGIAGADIFISTMPESEESAVSAAFRTAYATAFSSAN